VAKLRYIEPNEIRACTNCGSDNIKTKTVRLPEASISNVIYCMNCTSYDYSEAEYKDLTPTTKKLREALVDLSFADASQHVRT